MALCGCLAACGAPAALPTPTATLVVRPTLPPAWTLTPTPTRPPPTATPNPTLTPTLDSQAICDGLWVQTNLEDGRLLAWDAFVTLFASLPSTDAALRLLVVHGVTGEKRGIDLPGGEMTGIQIPVKVLLPGPGRYDWTLTLSTASEQDFCPRGGWFVVAGRESTRAEERKVR
ncbi:MAG: hypothetical protein DWB42_04310 [Chloroflexi bacterium]|nr:hypothetical protein [Chloroflexota bacterium]MDL1882649.1 hypothetical protein [Anaerolineae bacterium CFX8]